MASIEKMVPTLEDVEPDPARARPLGDRPGHVRLHDLLHRAEAGRTTRTARSEYHVVILDNGRSSMLGTEFQDMLRCIRCGACMNHCPVYQRRRRPRLWLGLSGPDGRGAYARR